MDDGALRLALEALLDESTLKSAHRASVERGLTDLSTQRLTFDDRADLCSLIEHYGQPKPPADPVAALIAAFQDKLPAVDPVALSTAIHALMGGNTAQLDGKSLALTIERRGQTQIANLAERNVVMGDLNQLDISVQIPIPDARFDSLMQAAFQRQTNERITKAAQQIESDRLLNLRLQGFVGRVAELAAIREHIEAMRPTGGYVLIKAAAGEGKSSSIAKLIQEAGIAATPHHFIALTTGREYQLGLLRAVVAQLILKHELTVSYFPEESYPAMKAEFARILDELSNQGIQETIYLDGLDQLQPEIDGSRDLSFLPPQPPPGIVIVLGSRPDETLKPLEILHRIDYDLPPLSEPDALSLWRFVQPDVADSLLYDLYVSLKGNALFVHLAADTIRDQSIADTTSLIKQIEQNPQNLFGTTLERMKGRSRSQWDTVWKPMLALLLVAQEPLRLDVLGDLLGHDHDTMQDAVWVLGGLVSQGIDQRVALHHLLFRDYLAVSVFNPREVKRWQQRMADWCAIDVDSIWINHTDAMEQARRVYARYHYVTHLALAENWTVLWQVLDTGDYGEYKTRFDPSTRLYALDLDRGREGAIKAGQSNKEHIQHLPRLWKYSLLRTSLTSFVDRWTNDLFVVLAMLGRTNEALERIELISNLERQIYLWKEVFQWCDSHQQKILLNRMQSMILIVPEQDRDTLYPHIIKSYIYVNNITEAHRLAKIIHTSNIRAEAFCSIAESYTTSHNIDQCRSLLKEAFSIAHLINDSMISGPLYHRIIKRLVSIDMINEATIYANQIDHPYDRAYALQIIVSFMAQKKDFNRAINLAYSIEPSFYFLYSLISIAFISADSGHYDNALILMFDIIRWIDILTDTKQSIQAHITIAEIYAKLEDNNQTGIHLHKAATLIHSIESIEEQVNELCSMAKMYNRMQINDQINVCLDNAVALAHTLSDPLSREIAFGAISRTYAEFGKLDQATTIASFIDDSDMRNVILSNVAQIILKHLSDTYSSTLLPEVWNIIQSIDDPLSRSTLVRDLVKAYIQNKSIDQANIILVSEVQMLSRSLNKEETYSRENMLHSITGGLVSIGDFISAKKVTVKINDPSKYVDALCDIANGYILINNLDLATSTIEEALQVIQRINNSEDKVYALVDLAKVYTAMTYIDKAMVFLKDALDTASMADSDRYIYMLDYIARTYTRIGNIDQAMAIAESIKGYDLWGGSLSLKGIAYVLAQTGNVELAFSIAQSLRWGEQNEVYLAIAQAYCARGNVKEATSIIQSIDDKQNRVTALCSLIQCHNKLGSSEKVMALIHETDSIIQSISDEEQYSDAMSFLAQTLVIIGELEQATILIPEIKTLNGRERVFQTIAKMHAAVGNIQAANSILKSIHSLEARVKTFLSIFLGGDYHNLDQILPVIQIEWQNSKTTTNMWDVSELIIPLLKNNPWLVMTTLQNEQWVNDQVKRLT